MAITITHAFVNQKPDGIDYTVVRPVDWNAGHIIEGITTVETHESAFNHSLLHASGSDDQDISGKVDKVTGKGLSANDFTDGLKTAYDGAVFDSHAAHSDDQDISGKVDKITGKGLSTEDYTSEEKTKLAGIATGANNYVHPSSHAPAIITQDASNRFVTDAEKTNYGTGYSHSQAAHAPTDAQKNSDITKAEIEAKLTGEIASHTHSIGAGFGYAISVQALTSSPADSATVYFGTLPKAPTTTANTSKVYVRKAITIKIAEIYCYSGTAGTAEAWSLYIRKNNTTDTLIATLSVSASERVFTNSSLNISMAAGDYFEIKGIQPAWATNPLTTIYGGYIYGE
jgi:hypothetical protein